MILFLSAVCIYCLNATLQLIETTNRVSFYKQIFNINNLNKEWSNTTSQMIVDHLWNVSSEMSTESLHQLEHNVLTMTMFKVVLHKERLVDVS